MQRKKSLIAFLFIVTVFVTSCGERNQEYITTESTSTDETETMSLEMVSSYEYRTQEIKVYNGDQMIYGIAYIPETEKEKVPLVICSHGLNDSYHSNIPYAEQLASKGVAAYCFDFRGGGGNQSDGDTTEMSVMTEVSDLETVLKDAAAWDFVDPDKIILLGASQGGIVSAITAARHADEVMGEILLYPAFLVTEELYRDFNSLDDVPKSYSFYGIQIGRTYASDMWNYDVYEEIGDFKKKVLLIHGNRDGIVDISYSERATEVYQDVEFYIINGAGHGFWGEAFDEAVEYIFAYLQELELV